MPLFVAYLVPYLVPVAPGVQFHVSYDMPGQRQDEDVTYPQSCR